MEATTWPRTAHTHNGASGTYLCELTGCKEPGTCTGTGKSTRGWWREASGQYRDRCPVCRKHIVTGARTIPAHA